jgi:hypothetical protein
LSWLHTHPHPLDTIQAKPLPPSERRKPKREEWEMVKMVIKMAKNVVFFIYFFHEKLLPARAAPPPLQQIHRLSHWPCSSVLKRQTERQITDYRFQITD